MEDHKIYIYQLEDIDDIKEEGKWSLYFVLSSYSIDLIRPIFQKINRLKERGSDIEVIIRTYDKNFSDEEIHTFTSLETILSIIHVPLYFDGGYKDYYSLEELIKTDKILDDVINRIKQAHLSPLETFLAVYQYLLKFQYKAESLPKEDEHPEESLYLSRDIISIINSDYIVCEGYARIMEYLLDNLGIKCFKQTLGLSEGAHMNNLVYLEDDKYQIKGLYYSDSCWDAEDDTLVFSLIPLSDVSKITSYIDIHSGYLPFYHVRNYKMLEDYQLLDAFLRSDQVYPDLIKKHHLEYYLEETYNQGIDLFIKNRNAAISLLVDSFKEMHVDADIYDITNGTLPYGTSLPFFVAMLILSKDNITIVKHQLRQILHFFETGLNKLSDEERPYFNKEMISNSSAGIMDLFDYLSKVQVYPYETLDLSLPLMQQLFSYENDFTPNPCLIFSYETINILQRAFMLPKMEEAAYQYPLGEPISLEIFRHALTESLKVEDLSKEEIIKKVDDMIDRTILLSKEWFYDADNCFYKEPVPQETVDSGDLKVETVDIQTNDKNGIKDMLEKYCEAVDNHDEHLKNTYITALMFKFWEAIKNNAHQEGLDQETYVEWLHAALDYVSQFQESIKQDEIEPQEEETIKIYTNPKAIESIFNFINHHCEEKIENSFAIKDDNK